MSLLQLVPLGVGEFSPSDKLQPQEYIASRLNVLQKFYKAHPELAQEVLSYTYEHPNKRPWLHTELQERLGLPTAPSVEKSAAFKFLEKFGAEFLASQFPSLAAAFDAYDRSRRQQELQAAYENQRRYPALSATQPAQWLLQQTANSGGATAMPTQPVHHRHYHRHHRSMG